MRLGDYINRFPKDERRGIRERIATAHRVSEVTVRSWANGSRRHPYDLESVRKTEKVTGQAVTRYDVRPDVYRREARNEANP